jgi:fucose 4-O-acetylase-like acetyltransferase
MGNITIRSVDLWKGLTILSILNIHTCFWSGSLYLPEISRRLCLLLDVPVFFFLSGFLMATADSRTVFARTGRQVKKLLSDYFLVSIVAVLSAIAINALGGDELFPHPGETLLSILRLQPAGVTTPTWRVFGPSMWFLKFFLFILLPASVAAYFLPKRLLILTCLAALAGSSILEFYSPRSLSFLRSCFFYLAIMMAGAAFKAAMDRFTTKRLVALLVIFSVVTVSFCLRSGGIPDLQAAKFPPTMLYLLFSAPSLILVSLFVCLEEKGKVYEFTHPVSAFFLWCGRNSYRIYLWQGFAASVPYFFLSQVSYERLVIPLYLMCLSWNISASLLLTALHNKVSSALKARARQQPAMG